MLWDFLAPVDSQIALHIKVHATDVVGFEDLTICSCAVVGFEDLTICSCAMPRDVNHVQMCFYRQSTPFIRAFYV